MRGLYRARLIFAAALAAIGVGALTLAGLVPSYMAVRYDAQSVLPTAASTAASASSSAAVLETRDLLAAVRQVTSATSSVSDMIRLVLSLRPSGVAVDSIGYIRNTSAGQIQLDGSTQHASVLEAYRAALSQSGRFAQVSVPVDSLAGTTNGKFSITLAGAF